MTKMRNSELINHIKIPINAIVGDLPLTNAKIDVDEKTESAFEILKKDDSLQGLILFSGEVYVGMLPRNRFFELLSKSYMREIYLKKPLSLFYENNPTEEIIKIPYYTLIVKAAEMALMRSPNHRIDPLVIETVENKLKLLDIYTLYINQIKLTMQAIEKLKLTLDSKKEILAIIAHDIKNPLMGIGGSAEMILEKTNEPEIKNFANIIISSSNRIKNQIVELIESEKSKESVEKLSISKMDLFKIINSSIIYFQRIADKKGQKILFDYNPNVEYEIMIDKIKIMEVFENLLSNAIKYSSLKTNIQVFLDGNENEVFFSIQDCGPGFNDGDKQKMYGKLQRLSALPTGGEESSGLGLYIVKKFVDMHDGKITLESELGKGSKFTVFLKRYLSNKILVESVDINIV